MLLALGIAGIDVERVALLVNAMFMNGVPSPARLGELGVARVSWATCRTSPPWPALERAAKTIYG